MDPSQLDGGAVAQPGPSPLSRWRQVVQACGGLRTRILWCRELMEQTRGLFKTHKLKFTSLPNCHQGMVSRRGNVTGS